MGNEGGQQQWVTTFKHKRGRVTRRATKSVEHIKHEREGQATRTTTVGDNGERQQWAMVVGDDSGAMKVGKEGGQRGWATMVGNNLQKWVITVGNNLQKWAMTVDNDGGGQRWATTVGWARRASPALNTSEVGGRGEPECGRVWESAHRVPSAAVFTAICIM